MKEGRCLGKPNPSGETYLPQGFLSGSFVFHAHIESSQLQPHGGHVEGVQRIMLTGRREETTGHPVKGCQAAHRPDAVCPWLRSSRHTLHGGQASPNPGRFWVESVDASTLSNLHECTSFCAAGVFLKSYIKTAGEILNKNTYKHTTQPFSQSFVLGAPKAGH